MKKKSIIFILATLMMLSSLVIGLEASATGNNSMLQATPQILPANTAAGNFYIYANGTVSNSSVIQKTGEQYTLLMNVYGTLTDYRNDSALNGNGFYINGTTLTALSLYTVHHVTLNNLQLTSDSNVLYLQSSNYVRLENSSVNSTSAGTNHAIFLEYSNYIWFNSDNITSQNEYVIYLFTDMVGLHINDSTIYGPYTVYAGDNIVNFTMNHDSVTIVPNSGNGGIDLEGDYSLNFYVSNSTFTPTNMSTSSSVKVMYFDTGTSQNIGIKNNTFYGMKPLYISEDFYVNISITSNTFINSNNAVDIYYADEVVVSHNTYINNTNDPVEIMYSSNILVEYNEISNYSSSNNYAIDVEDSTNVQVSGNIVSRASPFANNDGIYLSEDSPGTIFGNTVANFEYGIHIDTAQQFSVYYNSVYNSSNGIYASGNFVTIYSNNVVNSTMSLELNSIYNTVIYGNTFNSTSVTLELMSSTNVTLYHNNFLGISNSSTLTSDYSTFFNESLPVGGNYWSSYNGSGTSGVGNTQYNVSTQYSDYLPLLAPWTSYTVTFNEQGLGTGTAWSVELDGVSSSSSTSSIVYYPEAAQHISTSYSISPVSGYKVSTTSGIVSLDGSNKVVTLTFIPNTSSAVQYNLTIVETGLPAGMQWTATVNGTTYNTSGTAITILLSNGTYNVTIKGPSGYTVTVPANNVTVSNADMEFNVTFSAVKASGVGSAVLYGGISAAAVIGGAAGVFGTMFMTGTGIFRKVKGE